jgi:hypothetical protein
MRFIRVCCATATCSGVAMLTLSTGVGCFSASPTDLHDGGVFDATAAGPEAAAPEAGRDAPGGPDATIGPEAGTDAADSMAPEAETDAAEAGCAPGSAQGFVAPPYVHVGTTSSSCFGFYDAATTLAADCFGDAASFGPCAADTDASLPDGSTYASCLGCLVTPVDTDATYGATIQSTVAVLNLAGCVERMDPSEGGLGCAAALQAAWQCADYACRPSCPVTDDPSKSAYIACTQAAAAGVCSTYAAAANACLAAETDAGDSGVATNVTLNCFSDAAPTGDPTANLLLYFCGS